MKVIVIMLSHHKKISWLHISWEHCALLFSLLQKRSGYYATACGRLRASTLCRKPVYWGPPCAAEKVLALETWVGVIDGVQWGCTPLRCL